MVPTTKTNLKRAFRCEIKDQISDFKKNKGFPGCEVHHEPYFCELVSNFLYEYCINEGEIALEQKGCNIYFVDRDLANLWKNYHEKNAVLFAITPEEHRLIHNLNISLLDAQSIVYSKRITGKKRYKWNFLKKFLIYYSEYQYSH